MSIFICSKGTEQNSKRGGTGEVGSKFLEINREYPCICERSRDNLCPNVVQINLKIGSRLKLQRVEMEALTAVQVALLTIYDMCKAVDRGMVMGDVKLLEKSGGKSGEWRIDQ